MVARGAEGMTGEEWTHMGAQKGLQNESRLVKWEGNDGMAADGRGGQENSGMKEGVV